MKKNRPSLRQWLHFATGDRDKEGAALADRLAEADPSTDHPTPSIRETADHAVRAAHGDLGVEETRSVDVPVAIPDASPPGTPPRAEEPGS